MTQGYTKGVPIDTDPTMALNSNQLVPSQAAVVSYVAANSVKSSSGITQYYLQAGGVGNTITNLAALGSTGQVLQSAGAGAYPTFSTPTYPSTSGTSGKILVSDGTNNVYSTPTFPNASATTRKIIVSDGTNWIASTETYAVPGTTKNLMQSDGTNWTSAAPIFLQTASKTVTSAQIKAMRATPIELVAAPGAGKMIVVSSITGKFVYGGSNVFVAGAVQTIGVYYNNNTTNVSTTTLLPNAMIVSATSRLSAISPTQSPINNVALGIADNVNVALWQNGSATEISGNAANDNTLLVVVTYTIVTL